MIRVDSIFQKNIREILRSGSWDAEPRTRWADGTPARSRFITQVWEEYDISGGQFPLTNLRPVPWKSAIKEILWIYQDQSNDLDLLRNKYGILWWDAWESEDVPGTIGNRYGHTVRKHNLVGELVSGIISNPYGRRHIMTLWDEEDLRSSDGLYPCAYETLWAVRGQYLDCTLIQRSSDYLAANHINKIQYVALQMMIAHECGLSPGRFGHFVNNLHIYDRHLPIAEKMLELQPEPRQAELILPQEYGIYNAGIKSFDVRNYEPEKSLWDGLKLEIAI